MISISTLLHVRLPSSCAAIWIFFAIVGFFCIIYHRFGILFAFLFLGMLVPAVIYFCRWFLSCRKNAAAADFGHCNNDRSPL